jgi:hypothetical protein
VRLCAGGARQLASLPRLRCDRRDGWWQHWVDERKQAEHVRVTQMNGSDRDERGSLSRGGVLKQSEDVKNKTLEMAGVVRDCPSSQTYILDQLILTEATLSTSKSIQAPSSSLKGILKVSA